MDGWTVESLSSVCRVSVSVVELPSTHTHSVGRSVTRTQQPPAQLFVARETRRASKGAAESKPRELERAAAAENGRVRAVGRSFLFLVAPFPFAGGGISCLWARRWRWLLARPLSLASLQGIHPLVFPAQNSLARGTLVPRSSRAEPLVPFSQEAISTDHHRALADPCKRNPRRIKPFLGWGAAWRAWAGLGQARGPPGDARGGPASNLGAHTASPTCDYSGTRPRRT